MGWAVMMGVWGRGVGVVGVDGVMGEVGGNRWR